MSICLETDHCGCILKHQSQLDILSPWRCDLSTDFKLNQYIHSATHGCASVCAGELCPRVLLPAAERAVWRCADQAGHPPPLLQQRYQRDRLRPSAHLRFGGVQQTVGRQKHQPAPVHLPSPKIKSERGGGGGARWKGRRRRRRWWRVMEGRGQRERERSDEIKERHHWTTDTS